MSVQMYPQIPGLDPDGLCYRIYRDLYQKFFSVQDPKSEIAPHGIEEGDQVSIRLHNMAYNFASSISDAIGGYDGIPGVVLADYIRKGGDTMQGLLSVPYGFSAGIDNKIILKMNSDGVDISGSLSLPSNGLIIGRKSPLWTSDTTTYLQDNYIDFGSSELKSTGSLLFGDTENGLYLSHDTIRLGKNAVYHSGNANTRDVDWVMKDGQAHGKFTVSDNLIVNSASIMLHGFSMGSMGQVNFYGEAGRLIMQTDLQFNIGSGEGIKFGNVGILTRSGSEDIVIGAVKGMLMLGNENTAGLVLHTSVLDYNKQYPLITRTGAFYVPDSITVRHNFGEDLLSSYRKDRNDQGIIIHERLRFSSEEGSYLTGVDSGIELCSQLEYYSTDQGKIARESLSSKFYFTGSTSLLFPGHNSVFALAFSTSANLFVFNNPLEAKGRIGIDNSFTRLEKDILFLSDNNYLLSNPDGIRHFGNAYFMATISSEYFASGFAGSGWAIQKNETTGNTNATVDELTVRKRMRVYEWEIQKTSASNGALWISDSFSGETVEQIV